MAAIVPKRLLEEIRARNDIVEVVGSYLNLKRSGSSCKTLCPFHKEKTPSFNVSSQRQIYHCFGCGAGGDVFRFVMQYENVDFTTAAQMLAKKAGVPFEIEQRASYGEVDREVLYKIHAEVARTYHLGLLQSPSAEAARKYVKERKLTKEIVDEFQVGYAPDKWDVILAWLKKKYSIKQIEASGLVVKSEEKQKESHYYDRFRNRLIFPIRDEIGRTIAFSGRALASEGAGAKYINSPETLIFHKSRVLYALDKAKRSLADCSEALLCEGQIDAIRCHSGGFKTAVAPLGTAFTADHARILKRYVDCVVIVFDPDDAGRAATIKTGVVFLQEGMAVRVARLPQGEDPDAFILKNDADAFRAVIDRACSLVKFQVETLSALEDIKTEVGLMRVARALLQTIINCRSEVQRTRLIAEAASLLNLPPHVLQQDLRQVRATDVRDFATSAGTGQVETPPPSEELDLLQHLMAQQELLQFVATYLPLNMVSDPTCRQLFSCMLEAWQGNSSLPGVITEHDGTEGRLSRLAAEIQMAPQKTSGSEFSHEDAVKDIILYIWRKNLKRQMAEAERTVDASGEKIVGQDARTTQLQTDIKMLQRWNTGEPIMKVLR